MSALERCSESERCWWPDGSCRVCVVRKDDAGDHPVYRIVVVSGAEDGEEPRYLQSDFVKFSKLREAREPLERVLAPEKGAFPPSYTKSRFGASLSRRELEKRTLMVEDYFASAFRSVGAGGAPPEAERGRVLEALGLRAVAAGDVDEAELDQSRRRRALSLGEPDKVGGRQMAKSFSAMGIQSRGSALLHGDATRPKSETAAMARGSARFSLSTAFSGAARSSEVASDETHTLVRLASGPVGAKLHHDKWPPTVQAVTDPALADRLRVGDVVASFSVRDDHGKAVDTDCRLYTGDQLEIILAADDGSKTRVLHVDKAGSQAERNSIRARGLWGNVAKTVRAAAVVKSKK